MNNTRINDLEILRAIAVLAVVVQHAPINLFAWQAVWNDRLYNYFGGWIGVDIFFAISGFIIARSLIPKLQSSKDSQDSFRITLAFWMRRAWRLLPSAWLWLLIMLALSVLFRESGIFSSPKDNIEATVAGLLNLANFRLMDNFSDNYGVSRVYWSLSLEEQFYLVLPILVLLSKRFLVPVLLTIVFWQLWQERTLAMMVFRCDGLALGVLLAIWSRHSTYEMARPVFLRELPLKGTIPLIVIVTCLLLLGSHTLNIVSHRPSWIAILAAILVWTASYNDDLYLPRSINPIMLWLGSRSYAIYLIHFPAFLLTREIWAKIYPEQVPSNSLFWHYLLTATILIIVSSELNYRFIEMPLRKRGARIAERFENQDQKIKPSTSEYKIIQK